MEQHVGRRRQRYAVGQRFSQSPPADREIRRCIKRGEHGFDQHAVVGGIDAKAVADHVIEPAFSEIEFEMPGFFFRTLFVEAAA